MKLNPGYEAEFRSAWHSVTLDLIKRFNSLGARLHRNDKTGALIAYAQWGSREEWAPGVEYIDEQMKQLHMESWLAEHPRVLLQLTVVDDLLQLSELD